MNWPPNSRDSSEVKRTEFEGEPMDNYARFDGLSTFLEFRGDSKTLGKRIASIESALIGLRGHEALERAVIEGVRSELVHGASVVKSLSSQVDVVLHVAGIISALPFILNPDELIESLSLGAGNKHSSYDLVTDRQVAEFKFIRWRGADAVRQDNLLVDIVNLDLSVTPKRKFVYLTNAKIPFHWLATSKRSTRSALARRPGLPERFNFAYGFEKYQCVNEYWSVAKKSVELVDLAINVPALSILDE
jgi:hypothetical protein